MKNKLFAFVLALTMVLVLSACHKTEPAVLALSACHKTEPAEVTTTAPVVTEATETTTAKTTKATKTTTAKESKTADKTVIKNDVNLVGTWDDRYSQRATMEVRGGKNNVYRIHIHWGSTAFESEDWTMTGTFNDTTGELTYKDCTRTTITFDEEGNETDEVHYRNGTGKFLYNNGELTWQSDNDDYVDQCVFIQ